MNICKHALQDLLQQESHAMKSIKNFSFAKVREKLKRLIYRKTAQQRDVLRAKIILLASEGKENKDIARELGVNQQIVGKWRRRFFK